jgi:hypothetical protein
MAIVPAAFRQDPIATSETQESNPALPEGRLIAEPTPAMPAHG